LHCFGLANSIQYKENNLVIGTNQEIKMKFLLIVFSFLAYLQLCQGKLDFLSRRYAFDEANDAMIKRWPSYDMEDNLRIVRDFLKDENLYCGVRVVFERFLDLKKSYRGSCNQETYDQVQTMLILMTKHSKINPWKSPKSRGPLSQLVIESYKQLLLDCLVIEFGGQVDSRQEEEEYSDEKFYEQSMKLISSSDFSRMEDSKRGRVFKNILQDLRKGSKLNLLKKATSRETSKKWRDFFTEMLDGTEYSSKLDEQLTEEDMRLLFDRFFVGRCQKLVDGKAGEPLQKINELLIISRPELVPYGFFCDGPRFNYIHLAINARLCTELMNPQEEFISKLTEALNKNTSS